MQAKGKPQTSIIIWKDAKLGETKMGIHKSETCDWTIRVATEER